MAILYSQHPPALIFARQPVVFKVRSDVTDSPLRIGGGVTGQNSDSIPTIANREESFDFSDYLPSLITERGMRSPEPAIYSDIPVPITFTFFELYGSPASSHHTVPTALYYLLDGKVPDSRKQLLYHAYGSLLEYLVASKSCLSWYPHAEPKKVLPDQPEFLNLIQLQSEYAESLRLMVTLGFEDGTYEQMDQPFPDIYAEKYQLVYFPCGYHQLGIDSWVSNNCPDQIVKRYYVTIYSGNIPYSSVYAFEVDRTFYEHPRQLWIRNPFGLWEVLLVTGSGSQLNTTKNETADTDGSGLPSRINWKSTREEVVSVNTGFMPASAMKWISELLDSAEAYELINGVLHPIIFNDLKIPVLHDGEYQFSVDLEYQYVFNRFEIGRAHV